MEPEQKNLIKAVASDLYELARVKRGDSDSTFVEVRRNYLSALATQLMTVADSKEA